MRQPRLRVFAITIDGGKTLERREQAYNRVDIEVQHRLATVEYPGAFVRVVEKYIGGAKPSISKETTREE